MRFSVVIPTFNRSEKLVACLTALFEQDFDKRKYEIIAVDDGSTDDTAAVLKKLQKKAKVPFFTFSQPNQGQGAARNKGVIEAHGDIVILLGDDIVATPQLLREHERIHALHKEENAAVLGFITWHPKLPVTPLMQFMERGGAIFGRFGGHQFAFDLLEGKEKADFRFFYTSNISLKRSLLERFKFDPWFAGYGFEDIELGYRLTKKAGLQLYYAPDAIAYHDHMMNDDAFEARMRNIGFSSHTLDAKYPELGAVPSKRKQSIFRFLSATPTLALFKYLSKNLYFYALSKKYFLEGLEEGYNRLKVNN